MEKTVEERTFILTTRSGDIFEIENVISDEEIKKTKKRAEHLGHICSEIIAGTVITTGLFIAGIGFSLRKRFYIRDLTKDTNRIRMGTLLTGSQMYALIFSIVAAAIIIALLCLLYNHKKEQRKKWLHRYNEQMMRLQLLNKMQSLKKMDIGIEFGRNAFGDTTITFVVNGETYILSENIHRMPIEKSEVKRLRFMTNELYYMDSTTDRKKRAAVAETC